MLSCKTKIARTWNVFIWAVSLTFYRIGMASPTAKEDQGVATETQTGRRRRRKKDGRVS